MLTVILIEDKPDAEEKLRFLLTRYCATSLQIVASAHTGQAGIAAIVKYRPDLVFLDIELGDMTAFELLGGNPRRPGLLPGPQFHLVNLNHIRQFVRTDGGYGVMNDGATVSVARNRKEGFLELFSKF